MFCRHVRVDDHAGHQRKQRRNRKKSLVGTSSPSYQHMRIIRIHVCIQFESMQSQCVSGKTNTFLRVLMHVSIAFMTAMSAGTGSTSSRLLCATSCRYACMFSQYDMHHVYRRAILHIAVTYLQYDNSSGFHNSKSRKHMLLPIQGLCII